METPGFSAVQLDHSQKGSSNGVMLSKCRRHMHTPH